MIKSKYEQNLPDGTLYNSQIGAIIFVCGIVFKVSSLPGIAADAAGSSTLWLYLSATAIEVGVLLLIYLFMTMGGDAFLSRRKSVLYRAAMTVAMLYSMVKGVLYFAYTVLFLTNEMFSGLAPLLVIFVFLMPVIYMGVKGVRTIGRSAEILFILMFLGVITNLVFLDAKVEFERTLPFLYAPPEQLAKQFFRFGLWFGDMFPLVFVRMKKKRLPYIGLSTAVTAVLVNVIVLLGVAMYGDALPLVTNMLVRIATFSQLSMQIGRMEWISLFVVITGAMFALAFNYWGVCESADRAFNGKKIIRVIYPVVMVAVVAAIPATSAVVEFARTEIGYVLFALAVALPSFLLLLYAYHRRKAPEDAKQTAAFTDGDSDETSEDNENERFSEKKCGAQSGSDEPCSDNPALTNPARGSVHDVLAKEKEE